MQLETPKLIISFKEWVWVVLICFVAIFLQLFIQYQSYKEFIGKEKTVVDAKVIAQYPKNDYYVLKLKSQNLTFYTTKRKAIDNLEDDKVKILLFLKGMQIGFSDYLTHFYAPSHLLKVIPKQDSLHQMIVKQHQDSLWQEFYGAIFLAKPISKELREIVATFGISHLIALSGFHIGIISAILYFLLKPIYRYFHLRYFPYRYDLVDIGFIVAIILGYYLYLTDFPPSLVRSYGMFLVGWLLVIFGVSILSYSFLFFVVLILLAIDPTLLFSLGFYFSVCGVFYIYLLLEVIKDKNKLFVTIAISVWTFLAMNPITHYFFPTTSLMQLLSPLLTLAFTLFYPLTLLLHLFGIGGLLDFDLEFKLKTYAFKTPDYFYYSYLLLSLLAVKNYFKPLLFITVVGFNIYLFTLV